MPKTPTAKRDASRLAGAFISSPLEVDTGDSNAPALLRREGLAVQLDCSLRMIDRLQNQGMPCVFVGRSRRFIFTEVVAWLKRKGAR